MLILIGWFTSGLLIDTTKILPEVLQNLVPYLPLPTYYYGQLALWAGGIPTEHIHLWLDLQWLIWAKYVFGLFAVWGYRRSLN
ncbi:MAG: hypothetical protein SAK29_13690 [Scytonema sp. PMC 1069.18]|nr:hypothetical protein [Scytonema sp. PMC 1069.18]MEC4881022.1 hypothetical protein [Scytonema sp. PMC 1070.18]